MKLEFSVVKYPDGTFTTKLVSDPSKEQNHYVEVWINSYEDMWYLMQINDICNHNNLDPVLHIPCLLDAQADKRFHENESANLRLVCSFINNLGFKKVRVFHPHNPEAVEMALNNVEIVDNKVHILNVIDSIISEEYRSEEDFEKNTVLMSTDAGGFKPLMKLVDKIGWKGEVFSASKSRKWDEEKQKSVLTQQIDKTDFGGKDILIIDDLCVYGGTFVGLANLLKDRNCGKLYLAVSHITVPTPSKQLEEAFHRVFTTNSKYAEYQLNNVTVLPVPL